MVDAQDKLVVGKFKLLERLGVGGVGEVYRARQVPLERLVALKVLKPEVCANPAIRRRFAREARAVASLNHPNIITIYDFGLTENESLYLAMEYIDGQSLRTLVEKGMPTIPALLIMEQVLSGLGHAHARGLIHRDLKPENILVSRIDQQLHAKIVDFGIASLSDRLDEDLKEVAAKGKVIGTPSYMSPEQARGDETLTLTTDIYNLGLVLYEIVTGHHPFTATTPKGMMLAQCTASVPRPLPRPGFLLPEKLESIILRCLAKDPGERFPSASNLRNALSEVRQSMEDRGHALYLPIAPTVRGDTQGRITLVEGTPRIVASGPTVFSGAMDIPFVGRDDDKRFLVERVESVARDRRGAIVFVEGEAGVGKTRLVSWLKDRVSAEGSLRCLTGRYLQEVSGEQRGLREVFDQLLGTKGMKAAQAAARIASQLLSWDMTSARDAGLLIQMLRRPETGSSEPVQSGDELEELFNIMCRVLQAAGEAHPLAIILDDLHWCTSPSCGVLSYLAMEMASHPMPVLLIATVRSEALLDNPKLASRISSLAVNQGSVVFRRRIGRMRPEELNYLVQHVLPAHESLASAVIQRAEGNPLFVLQIVRHLIDEQLVQPTPTGTYTTANDVNVAELVPPNLADLIMVRLTQMEKRHPEQPLLPLLGRAAVLGSRFPFQTLAQVVSEDPVTPPERLESLVDILLYEGVLVQGRDSSDDILEFDHAITRDVLLLKIAPLRATRRLHLMAAQAKRQFYLDREELVAQQLSVHYELGHDFGQAVHYAQMAGTHQEASQRPAEAIAAWKRFLRIQARLTDRNREELSLLPVEDVQARLGELQEDIGLYDEAEETFRKLVPHDEVVLTQPVQVRAALGLAAIALNQGRVFQAQSLFEASRTAAKEMGNIQLIARAGLGLANVAWHHGRVVEAMLQAQIAYDEAIQAGDRTEQAQVLWFLGDVQRLTGEPDQSEQSFRQALAIFQDLKHPRGIARCLYGLALVARGADHLEDAERFYTQAYQVLEPIGVRKALGHCLNGLGEVARFRNRLGEATDYYRRAVEIFQQSGLPTDAAVSLTNLGLVARDSGDLEAAKDAMERALRVAKAANYRYLTLGIAFNLSWVYALLGQRAQSKQLLEEYLEKGLRYGLVDPDFARPLEGIAELLDAAGETVEARQLYERARDMWEDLKRDQDVSRVSALLR